MKQRIAGFLRGILWRLDPTVAHPDEPHFCPYLDDLVAVRQKLREAEPSRPHECPRADARAAVAAVLDRPIEWVDWRALSPSERKAWGAQARAALDNRPLQSVMGKSALVNGGEAVNGEFVRMCIESIARESRTQEQTENLRHVIVGIERLREMLEEMCVSLPERADDEDLNAPL